MIRFQTDVGELLCRDYVTLPTIEDGKFHVGDLIVHPYPEYSIAVVDEVRSETHAAITFIGGSRKGEHYSDVKISSGGNSMREFIPAYTGEFCEDIQID